MDPIIETTRLTLVQLTDTSEGSQHLQYFHEYWNDDLIASNSRHGKCHTIEESRAWMIKTTTELGGLNYAILLKAPPTTTSNTNTEPNNPGKMIGNVALWRPDPDAQPDLPPLSQPPTNTHRKTATATATATATDPLKFNTYWISYALFQPSHAKGYTTEAAAALISAYKRFVAPHVAKGDQRYYIEGHTDEDKYASQRILEKLGFQRVGWLQEEGEWRNGKWSEGCWVYGLEVF